MITSFKKIAFATTLISSIASQGFALNTHCYTSGNYDRELLSNSFRVNVFQAGVDASLDLIKDKTFNFSNDDDDQLHRIVGGLTSGQRWTNSDVGSDNLYYDQNGNLIAQMAGSIAAEVRGMSSEYSSIIDPFAIDDNVIESSDMIYLALPSFSTPVRDTVTFGDYGSRVHFDDQNSWDGVYFFYTFNIIQEVSHRAQIENGQYRNGEFNSYMTFNIYTAEDDEGDLISDANKNKDAGSGDVGRLMLQAVCTTRIINKNG